MKTRWLQTREAPPAFLPIDLDVSGMMDVTALGDAWRKYNDPNTGTTHDGADYHAQYIKESVK